MDNRIDKFRGEYRFLSNFYSAKTLYEGIEYPSSEHAFQAAKTTDLRWRRLIAALETPAEAKRMGNRVPLRSDWEEVRIDVMRKVIKSKFSDTELMKKLKATGDAELIEGNTWRDFFWGICNGRGKNWLGKILMEIRK